MKFIIGTVLSICMLNASSQGFFHKIGGQANYFTTQVEYTYSVSGGSGDVSEVGFNSFPGILYQAGFDFELADGISIAPTVYPMFGISIGEGQNYIAYELPVMVELFFGDREEFGGFFDLGYSYMAFSESGYSGLESTAKIGGLQLGAGMNFNTEDSFIGRYVGGRGFSFRLAYTIHNVKPVKEPIPEGYNFTKNKYSNVISLGLLVDL